MVKKRRQPPVIIPLLIVAMLGFSSGYFFHDINPFVDQPVVTLSDEVNAEEISLDDFERVLQSKLQSSENDSSTGFDFRLMDTVWKTLKEKYVKPELFSESEPFEFWND